MIDPPVLLDAKEQGAWEAGQQAKEAMDTLRMYLMTYAMAPYGGSLSAVEAVRDRVVFFLDEYRRLNAQQQGAYSAVTCGAPATVVRPPCTVPPNTAGYGMGTYFPPKT